MTLNLTYEDREAIRIAKEIGQTLPCEKCVGSGLLPPGEIGQCPACHGTGVDFCPRHCSVCEGSDHHWMPDCDEETGEPEMVCKHCDKKRPYTDDEEA